MLLAGLLLLSFNPPPAFRKGETRGQPVNRFPKHVSIRPPPFGRGKLKKLGLVVGTHGVSIRPPPFGRGKPGCRMRCLRADIVSIRPPPFGRGKRFSAYLKTVPFEFQSAPRLSEGGNLFCSHFTGVFRCFNPPPAFRKGETGRYRGFSMVECVSIRPPPFGRGKRGDDSTWAKIAASFNPPPAFRKGETR